jgi:hypothetical protein
MGLIPVTLFGGKLLLSFFQVGTLPLWSRSRDPRGAFNWERSGYGSEPVIVFELWVKRPHDFYRGGNRTQLWDELPEDEKGAHPLLLCRPFIDSSPERESSRIRREKLLATWLWDGRLSWMFSITWTCRPRTVCLFEPISFRFG